MGEGFTLSFLLLVATENAILISERNTCRRHPVGGLPSSRLLKGRGSVIPGDESTLGGEEEEEKEM